VTNASPPLRLHLGHTTHRRFTPFTSSFRYRVAMIDLDIDRLEACAQQTRLFGVERSALFTFDRKDHGALERTSLRRWAEAELEAANLEVPRGMLRLITFPRHIFYKFAPISLWLFLDTDERPAAILYEVRNTFGERHTYAAALDGQWSRHEAPKRFHVSPFFDVSGQYQFSLQYNSDALQLGVTTIKDGKPVHMASLSTVSQSATDANLLSVAFKLPLSTIGVTLGIHWEALKLWAKGARYHRRPSEDAKEPTLAVTTGRQS